jgi:hypothetical protein
MTMPFIVLPPLPFAPQLDFCFRMEGLRELIVQRTNRTHHTFIGCVTLRLYSRALQALDEMQPLELQMMRTEKRIRLHIHRGGSKKLRKTTMKLGLSKMDCYVNKLRDWSSISFNLALFSRFPF